MSASASITEPRREWRPCLVCGSGPFLLALHQVCASCEIIGLAELPDDEDLEWDFGESGDGLNDGDLADPADEREERANDEAEEEEERRRKEEENDHDDERKRDDAREHI